MKYTLYDGPDALIANKLLEMGISINPGNVDWYKRTLIPVTIRRTYDGLKPKQERKECLLRSYLRPKSRKAERKRGEVSVSQPLLARFSSVSSWLGKFGRTKADMIQHTDTWVSSATQQMFHLALYS